MKKKWFAVIGLSVLLGCLLIGLCGCGEEAVRITKLEDVKGVRVGVQVGALDEQIYEERFKDTCERVGLSSIPDEITALKANKIDCFATDEFVLYSVQSEIEGLVMLPEVLLTQNIGTVFKKDDPHSTELRKKFNAFLSELTSDGTLDEMKESWLKHPDTAELDMSGLTGENGTLMLAANTGARPFSFLRNNEIVGFEVDLFVRFCRAEGYMPQVNDLSFDGLMVAIDSGKADMGVSCMGATPERMEAVDFSDFYFQSEMHLVVRGEEEPVSFFESIGESFRKTFVEEERWKIILKGLGTTLAMLVITIPLGTVLGFGLYFLCRKAPLIVHKILDGISWVLGGLPAVVLLMICFYIIFGKSSIPGFWVAVIAFSLLLMFSIYSALYGAVESVDLGQLDGAYSLGFTDFRALWKIILPQAMTSFLPSYKSILVGFAQSTSVVGYIAVEDLTAVSDMIRGRTYEAFFPLISTALIYLLVCWLLTVLINQIRFGANEKSRTKEQVMRRFLK